METWNSEAVRQYLTADATLEKELKIEFDKCMKEEQVREWEEQAAFWTAERKSEHMLFCVNKARDLIAVKRGDEEAAKAVAALVAGLLPEALKWQNGVIAQNILIDSYKDYMRWVNDYQRSHHGKLGLERQRWVLRTFSGDLVILGSLQFEKKKWDLPCVLFKNKVTGVWEMLSNEGCGEENDCFYGKRIMGQDGSVTKEMVSLRKCDWNIAAGEDTPVLGIHIPEGADLRIEAVKESIRFAKKYFGEEKYRFLVCESWLLDPHLKQMLSPKSRILEFASLFWRTPIAQKERVPQILERVFGPEFRMEDLEKQECVTQLQKALKNHLLSGGMVGSMGGYLSWNIV